MGLGSHEQATTGSFNYWNRFGGLFTLEIGNRETRLHVRVIRVKFSKDSFYNVQLIFHNRFNVFCLST